MGKYDYLKSYERQIESIVILISSIYCFTELILGYRNSWNPWGQAAVFVPLPGYHGAGRDIPQQPGMESASLFQQVAALYQYPRGGAGQQPEYGRL